MEEQNNIIKEPKKKGNGLIITILIIIIVILLGVIVISVIKPKDKETNNTTDDNKPKIIEQEEPNLTTEETNKTENTSSENTNTTEPTKEDRIVKVGDVSINLDKCKNCNANEVYSSPTEATSQNNGLSLSKTDSKTLTITIDFSKYANLCQNFGCKYEENEIKTYPISSNEKITKYIIGGRGQDYTSTKIIFLDEGGAANVINLYTPATDENGNSTYHFNNNPRISEGLGHNMIALFNVSVQPKDSPVGGYVTTIGVLEDGSFYDVARWSESLEK